MWLVCCWCVASKGGQYVVSREGDVVGDCVKKVSPENLSKLLTKKGGGTRWYTMASVYKLQETPRAPMLVRD